MSLTLPRGIRVSVVSLSGAVARPTGAAALIVPAQILDAADVGEFARKVCGWNCVLVAVVGSSAERVHDRLDEALLSTTTLVRDVPMTTWHDDESSLDVLNLAEQVLANSNNADGEIRIVSRQPIPTASDVQGVLRVLDRARLG